MFVRVSNVLPIRKKIFVISKVQFHHEGGLSKSNHLELFFVMVYIFGMPKISLY